MVFDKVWQGIRYHGGFLLLFVGFYTMCLLHLLEMSSWDLANDEFLIFDHSLHILREGHFVPGLSIDSAVLVGVPRGFLFVLMTVASMAILGVNELAARIPALVAGALTTGAFYWFILRTTGRRRVAILGIVVVMLTPVFVRWHFVGRFYTLILLLQVLSMLFLYEGIEGGNGYGNSEQEEYVTGASAYVKRFIRQEGVQPGYLVLFTLVYVLNLNQHPALLLCVPAAGSYGLVCLGWNLWELYKGKVQRLQWKYLLLSCIIPFCFVLAIIPFVYPEGLVVTAIPLLEKVPAMLHKNFDPFFGQLNIDLAYTLFSAPMTFVVPGVSLLGAMSWRWFAPKRYGKLGLFLAVIFAFLLLTGVFGWRRYAPRYGLFMLAMSVPLMAMGTYALGRGVMFILGKEYGLKGGKKCAFAAAFVFVVFFQSGVLWSGQFPREAFTNPFGFVEQEKAYNILYSNLRPGDYVLASFVRRWYAGRMMDRHGVNAGDYQMETFDSLSMEQLRDVMLEHQRGWIMWERQKGWHFSEDARRFCQKHLYAHHTPKGTVRLYSWDQKLPKL